MTKEDKKIVEELEKECELVLSDNNACKIFANNEDFKTLVRLLVIIRQQEKEIEELKKNIKEIMRKDRNCLTFGYHSAYVGLLDDLIKLIEE